MWYTMDHMDGRTDMQTKFDIEHTSVGLAHTYQIHSKKSTIKIIIKVEPQCQV